MALVCIICWVFVPPFGSRCSWMTFSRSCFMSNLACLLFRVGLLVRIMSYLMSILMFCVGVGCLGSPPFCLCAGGVCVHWGLLYCQSSYFFFLRHLSVLWGFVSCLFTAEESVCAEDVVIFDNDLRIFPISRVGFRWRCPFSYNLVIILRFLHICPLLPVSHVMRSFFFVWYSICLIWIRYSFRISAA